MFRTSNENESVYQFQQIPVKDVVISKTLTMEQTTKQLAQVRVVRLIIKTKRSTVVQVSCKLRYKKTAIHSINRTSVTRINN